MRFESGLDCWHCSNDIGHTNNQLVSIECFQRFAFLVFFLNFLGDMMQDAMKYKKNVPLLYMNDF